MSARDRGFMLWHLNVEAFQGLLVYNLSLIFLCTFLFVHKMQLKYIQIYALVCLVDFSSVLNIQSLYKPLKLTQAVLLHLPLNQIRSFQTCQQYLHWSFTGFVQKWIKFSAQGNYMASLAQPMILKSVIIILKYTIQSMLQ